MMYTIYLQDDGSYLCCGRIQDGTERWTKATLDEAVTSMKNFAEFMNGEKKLKKKHIAFFRPIQVMKTQWQQYNPFKEE